MLHRIRKIISVSPYIVVCEWTNGEIRAIQMEEKIKEWSAEPGSVYKSLLNTNIFTSVQLDADSKTLYWNDLIQIKDVSGNSLNAHLDLDPEVLYQMSIPFSNKTEQDIAA